MTTPKQLAANQRNARSSTGPWTDEGKAVSAQNALKHGLCSLLIVVPGEAAEEFDQFAAELLAQLAPAGALEVVFAIRVVQAAWRLRRAIRLEQQILQADHGPGGAKYDKYGAMAEQLGWRVSETDKYGRLCRYESHLDRALYRALHELQRLQAARAGQAAPAPLAVDVHVSGVKET